MNLYFEKLNHHKPITSPLMSMIAAMFLGIVNNPLTFAQTLQGDESIIMIGNPDGSAINVEQGKTFMTPIRIHHIPEGTNIGSVIINIHYDDTLFMPLMCEELARDLFSIRCEISRIPSIVQLNALSRESGFSAVDLVELEWEVIGPASITTTLRVDVQMFTDNNGIDLPYPMQILTPCCVTSTSHLMPFGSMVYR